MGGKMNKVNTKNGWREVKLGEIAILNYGKALPENKRIIGKIPVFSSAGLTGWHDESLIQENGIIIGRKGTIGSVYKSNTPFFPIDTVFYIKESEAKCNLNYLYYLLTTLGLNNLNSDSAVPGLNRNAAYEQSFLLPSLPEQKAIAEVLSSLDDKIDLLHRQNKTLEEMAQTLFRKWFMEEAKNKWEIGRLKDIAILRSGYAFKSNDFVERSDCKVIKIKNLKGAGIIDMTDVAFIKPELAKSKKIQYFKLDRGNILLAMSGNTTGKIGVVPIQDKNSFLNQRVGKFFVKNKKFRNFLYLFLMSGNFEEIISNMGYGSAQPNINPSQLHEVEVIIPPQQIISSFDFIVEPIFSKIFQNQSQARALTTLRDSLLPRLINGELSVKRLKIVSYTGE